MVRRTVGRTVNMDWNGYEIYHPGVFGPLETLPRREARQAFNRLMAAKSARIEMLRGLLKANGVELGSTDAAVQDLNDWFRANVSRRSWAARSAAAGLVFGGQRRGVVPR